jgi:hypothetical protein
LAPVVAPTSVPIKTPTISPTNIPTKAPTIAPIPIPVPVPVPVPIPGVDVRATPYTVVYSPTGTFVSSTDFMLAIDLTCAHVDESLRANLAPNPFIFIAAITCKSTSTSTPTAQPTTIQYELSIIFTPASLVLSPDDINTLLLVAFEEPQVTNLLNDFDGLPSTNSFSQTTSIVYSKSSAPILAPKEVVSSDSSSMGVSSAYGVSIVGFIGMALFMISLCISRNRRAITAQSRQKKYPMRCKYVSKPSFTNHDDGSGLIDFLSSRHADYRADTYNDDVKTSDPLQLLSQIRSTSNN